MQVSQDFNSAKIPQVLRTYDWTDAFIENGGLKDADPLLHDRYISSIESSLNSKGFSKNSAADFKVRYSYHVKTKIQSSPTVTYGLGRSRYGRYGSIGYESSADIRQYDVGYVFIDFIDSKTNEVFWRGKGSSLVTVHTSPDSLSKKVYETVDSILQQFPGPR